MYIYSVNTKEFCILPSECVLLVVVNVVLTFRLIWSWLRYILTFEYFPAVLCLWCVPELANIHLNHSFIVLSRLTRVVCMNWSHDTSLLAYQPMLRVRRPWSHYVWENRPFHGTLPVWCPARKGSYSKPKGWSSFSKIIWRSIHTIDGRNAIYPTSVWVIGFFPRTLRLVIWTSKPGSRWIFIWLDRKIRIQ